MSKFNKLYNLILQSIIISQNKADRKRMIDATDYDDENKGWLIAFLDNMAESKGDKLATFLCRYFADKTLTKFDDLRIDQVKDILKRQPSIDTQGWKGSLDQFIDKYMYTLEELEQRKKYSDLDNIKEFSDKEVLEDGVVTYQVQDSKEGMMAIRKIVDYQRGKDANPWCIIARGDVTGMKGAWEMWEHYNAFPKRIAFQNGKLLAMCASARKKTWWDLDDRIMDYNCLVVNGKKIKTKDVHMYTRYQKQKIALENFKKQLIYNPETKRYDSKTSLKLYKTITNADGSDEDVPVSKLLVRNGKLTIPFGKITGAFDCSCLNLKTLQNCPEYVVGQFVCEHNLIKDLVGGPKKVGGDYDVLNNYNLRSFKGKPEYLGGKIQGTPLTSQPYFTKGWKDFDDAWKDNQERS